MPLDTERNVLSAAVRAEGTYESIDTKLVGECYGASVLVDVRGATDPDSLITITQWVSEDDGVTWRRGAVNSGRGDPSYATMTPRAFSTCHSMNDGKGGQAPRFKDPLFKYTIEIEGAPARVGLGPVKAVTEPLVGRVDEIAVG